MFYEDSLNLESNTKQTRNQPTKKEKKKEKQNQTTKTPPTSGLSTWMTNVSFLSRDEADVNNLLTLIFGARFNCCCFEVSNICQPFLKEKKTLRLKIGRELRFITLDTVSSLLEIPINDRKRCRGAIYSTITFTLINFHSLKYVYLQVISVVGSLILKLECIAHLINYYSRQIDKVPMVTRVLLCRRQ